MTRLDFALEQIRLARGYTCWLLDAVEPALWYTMPAGGVTHVAWEAGHLAMAQYVLCIERVRGERDSDADFVSPAFLDLFRRGTVPDADAGVYPPLDEIRAVLDRVHQQVMTELAGLTDAQLDEPPTREHPQFTTKFGALTWCARHEMLHAGHIALIRRQLGAEPLR